MVFKVVRLTFIVFTCSYFVGIFWMIFTCDLTTQPSQTDGIYIDNFCTKHIDSETEKFDKLVKVWYYAITTLSTVGYGDLYPITPQERLLDSVILLFGVMVFSFIMAQFIDIFNDYNGLWSVGFEHKELEKWIATLGRFNNG